MNRFLSSGCAAVALLPILAFQAWGQATLHTIFSNTPPTHAYNVVILSEGYTSAQLPQFLAAATNAVNTLFSVQPFKEYRPACNAFAIAIASAQSGSDHPVASISRDTYFNSSYDPVGDYIITIPAGSSGQGKVDALLQTFLPDSDLSILLVNDLIPGGSDGASNTAITASGSVSDIMVHEIGHVAAGLGDEYTLPYPGYPDIEEPNTTRETNRASIKWNAWIAPETPVPTPTTYPGVIGLFEGAHYHATGWYRPKLNCRMRSPSTTAFCEVCNEALLLAIYRQVRPIRAYSPVAPSISLTSNAPAQFTVSVLQPASHTLSIQWLTNGIAVPAQTNITLSCLPQSLFPGDNSISVTVADQTDMVRNDPESLLTQSIAWTVHVTLPGLTLDTPLWLDSSRFAFRISGNAPQGFVVQTSTNLSNWTALSTNYLAQGQFWFTNSPANPQRSFFRAKIIE